MKVQRNWFRFVSALVVCSLLLLTLGAAAPSSPTVRAIVTGTSLEAAIVAVEAHGGQVASEIEIINAVVADVPESRLMFLSGAPGVRNVTLDRQVEAAAQGGRVNVEFTKAIGAAEVWEAGTLGEGVTVAFLDSGVDPTFIELRRSANGGHSRLLAYYDAISEELYEPPHLLRSPRDPNGHGTHVAGIATNSRYEWQDKEFRGVAPAADIVAVRVLNETGVGTYADVLRGINWVVQNKDLYNIRVLNISMYAVPQAPYWADPYNLAAMAAWQSGIVVVASAGNTGPAPLSVGVPGNTPYVITVGAYTDHRTPLELGDDYIPEFSAAGPTLDAFVKPDVIAPGAHIVSLMRRNSYLSEEYPDRRINGRYFEMAGTSMSTAAVSGIAALMLDEHPELTPDQVKYRLMSTARPQFNEATGETAYSIWQQGAGRVWAADAVLADIDGTANGGMDLAADLAGQVHYQGWSYFDPDSGTFELRGGGFDSWADGYTTWSGGYDSWADGYDSWADSTNWSGGFDSWADGFDSWADGFDSWADGYDSWADGFDSWADGYDSWADACYTGTDGYDSWADGFDSWADGYDSWADGFDSWADGYDSWADFVVWADGYDSWADGFDSWADANTSTEPGCVEWADGYDSWADGFDSWADGYDSWADGIVTWTSAYGSWSGGYLTWGAGFDSWADGFDSWADGYDSWADTCGFNADGFDSWADGYDSWADGYDSWADGFDSWADFILWADGFDSWADGFDSWADGLSLPEDGEVPAGCVGWLGGFDSWADGFDSWADGFDSWADAAPTWTSSFELWNGGYTIWAGGYDSWADGYDSWADNVGDPTWADDFVNLNNIPSDSSGVSMNFWIDELVE